MALFFITDAFAKLDIREKTVSQNIFHVHHLHVKMGAHADKLATIPMNANAHQVSKHQHFFHQTHFNL